jgi:hypothetical protein
VLLSLKTPFSSSTKAELNEFDGVGQVIAHPLVAIEHLMSTSLNQMLPFTPSADNTCPLHRALIQWFSVHALIKTFADMTLGLPSIASTEAPHVFRSVHRVTLHEVISAHAAQLAQARLTWSDLRLADPYLASLACKLARRFDYSCDVDDARDEG